jgi:hypothetical protein
MPDNDIGGHSLEARLADRQRRGRELGGNGVGRRRLVRQVIALAGSIVENGNLWLGSR